MEKPGMAGEPASTDAVLYLDTPDAPRLESALPDEAPRVHRLSSAESLLERLEADRSSVACVVAAHDPPAQDGLAVLSSVRSVHPTVSLVLCSTVEDPTVAGDAVARDADQFVPAPAHDDPGRVLADRVRETIHEGRSSALGPWELFDNFGDGILVHDTETDEILDCNRRFCEMLGYDRSELLEMEVSDISATDHPVVGNPEEKIARAAVEGPQVFEWVDLTASGEELPVEVCLTQTEVGGNSYVIAAVRDISDRKRTERLLEQKNERLERFASIISHDLRNPLYAAMAKRELAEIDCCDDCEHLDELARLHARMDDIIEDVLSLARERSPALETNLVDLQGVFSDAWEFVDSTDATVHLEGLEPIEADRDRTGRLVENLVANAIDHAGEAPTIEAGMLADGFYVADDGPGIPPERRAEVFEYGYTTAEDGSGLGLNIVRRIAEMHGWRVDVTESDAGGTRVEITGVTVDPD